MRIGVRARGYVAAAIVLVTLSGALAACGSRFPDATIRTPIEVDPNSTTTTFGVTESTSISLDMSRCPPTVPWDVSPAQLEWYAQLSSEQACSYQEKVNAFGPPPDDQIQFQPILANEYIEADGLHKIFVDVFVRNGTKEDIWDIRGRLTLKVAGVVVADGNFNLEQGKLGEVPSGMSRYWTLDFTGDAVKKKNVNLTGDLTMESSVTYSHPTR